MSDSEDRSRLSIGGNNPPALLIPTVLEINSHLTAETKRLKERVAEVSKMVPAFLADHQSIETEETQGVAADIVAQIRGCAKSVEDRRKKQKEPWLDGGKVVDAYFKKIADTLVSTAPIERLQTAYAKEVERKVREAAIERARLAKEEADLLEAQAAAALAKGNVAEASHVLDQAEVAATDAFDAERLASARPAEHSRTQSDFGVTSSLREVLVITLKDKAAVPLEYMDFSEVRVRAAVMAAKKNKQPIEIPGVEIVWDKKIGNYSR